MSVVRRKGMITVSYLDIIADMPSALRKINKTEPTPMSAHYVARFDVSVLYSNTMQIFHQLVHLVSANHASLNNDFGMNPAAYRSEALSSSQAVRVLSHKSSTMTSK
jgi:hypothetical protein